MDIRNKQDAIQWVRAWGARVNRNRLLHLLESQRLCVQCCGNRIPETKSGHQEAVDYIETLLTNFDSGKDWPALEKPRGVL